jgi:phospholipase/carboxylesterase
MMMGAYGKELLRGLEAAGVRMEFPTADARSFSPNQFRGAYAWFDQEGMDPGLREKSESVQKAAAQIYKQLALMHSQGVPADRIIVGGYDQGGSLALQLVLRYPNMFRAAFSISGYINDNSEGWATSWRSWKSSRSAWPKVLMAYSDEDEYVLPTWVKSTAKQFQKLGVNVEMLSIGGYHGLQDVSFQKLTPWIRDLLGIRLSDWTRPKIDGELKIVRQPSTEL